MKPLLALLTLLLVQTALYGQYNGDTAPPISGQDWQFEQRINKILNDAKTGSSPLNVTGSILSTGTASVLISGTARGLTVSTVTASGTVAAGLKSLDLIFSPDFSGTIVATGTVALSGTALSGYSFPVLPGDTLPAVPYTITTGTMGIIQLR